MNKIKMLDTDELFSEYIRTINQAGVFYVREDFDAYRVKIRESQQIMDEVIARGRV